jgi:tetratricopeptide (TPR) repeat protein
MIRGRRKVFVDVAMIILLVGCLGASAGAQTNGARTLAGSTRSTKQLELGRVYGERGDWRKAERELRDYRNAHPDSVDGIVLHAESLIQIGQPFDAALELQKFLQSHPDAVRPLELHASLSSEFLRDVPLAQLELKKVTRLAPRDARAWKELAQMYIDQEDMKSACEALQSAENVTPQDPVVVASLGYVDGETGKSEKAAAQFEKALRLAKTSPRDSALVHMLYGRFLLENGKPETSIEAFDAVLKVDEHYAQAYYWRARAYQQLANVAAAEADALQSIRLDPTAKEAPLLLVGLYRREGKAEKAQEYADMVTRLSDEKEAQQVKGRKLRDDLGEAERLLLTGNFAEATTRYESIAAALPTYYEAYFDLGMCYAQTGRGAEAEAAFRKYLGFQPVSSDGRAALGILLLSEGKGTEAVPELEQAIQIDPTLIEARKALAMEYLRESQPKSAIAILQSQSKVPDKDLQLIAAQAYLQNGQFPAALRSVERALVIAPGDPQSLEMKEQILVQQREGLPKAHSQIWTYGLEPLRLKV